MKPVHGPVGNDTLYGHIDEMPISATEREHTKARLREAERVADGIHYVLAAVRSRIAWVARHVRTALTASPQH